MATDEWLTYGGTEVVNLARTASLAAAMGIDSLWVDPEDVAWVEAALPTRSWLGRGGCSGGGVELVEGDEVVVVGDGHLGGGQRGGFVRRRLQLEVVDRWGRGRFAEVDPGGEQRRAETEGGIEGDAGDGPGPGRAVEHDIEGAA